MGEKVPSKQKVTNHPLCFSEFGLEGWKKLDLAYGEKELWKMTLDRKEGVGSKRNGF